MTQINFDDVFQLPSRDLKGLSFSRTDAESVRQWVLTLPKADMAKSTRMLYLAIKEVCELNCSPAIRMEIIDVLAPEIHFALEGLAKKYLNQHIILPDQPRKIAALCHALQNFLATAYISVASQASEKMGSLFKKPTALMSRAIYLALAEHSAILMRNYQLYRPDIEGFWKTCHRLYLMAGKFKLEKLPQTQINTQKANSSIEHAYNYLLLLGGIRANQLRQEDIGKLQTPLWHWASLVTLVPIQQHDDSRLIVDPNSDWPPVYQKYYQGKLSNHCLALDTTKLVDELKLQSSLIELKKLNMTQNLLNHLILAWGVFTDRTFMRLESDSRLVLGVGLSTAHFFLSGQKDFTQFVYGKNKSMCSGALVAEFSEQTRQADKLDVWDTSLFGSDKRSEAQVTMESIDYHIRTGGNSTMTLTGSDKEKYQHFEVNVVNMSPGGYCLKWDHEATVAIRAGEIIVIKESQQAHWNLGAIRWVRQDKDKSLQLGVELLSPNAEPYAIRHADREGQAQSNFLRTLLLPEIKATNQEASLLVPSMLFKVGQTAVLARDGRETQILLKKQLSSTGSFSQFSYQEATPLAQEPSSGKIANVNNKKDDFDAVWELL